MKTYLVKLKTDKGIKMELTVNATTSKQAEFRLLNMFVNCVIEDISPIQVESIHKIAS